MRRTSGYQPIIRAWRAKVRLARHGERHYQDRTYCVLANSVEDARREVRAYFHFLAGPVLSDTRGWFKIRSVRPWLAPRMIRYMPGEG